MNLSVLPSISPAVPGPEAGAPGGDARTSSPADSFPGILSRQEESLKGPHTRPSHARKAQDRQTDPAAASATDSTDATLSLIANSAALPFARHAPPPGPAGRDEPPGHTTGPSDPHAAADHRARHLAARPDPGSLAGRAAGVLQTAPSATTNGSLAPRAADATPPTPARRIHPIAIPGAADTPASAAAASAATARGTPVTLTAEPGRIPPPSHREGDRSVPTVGGMTLQPDGPAAATAGFSVFSGPVPIAAPTAADGVAFTLATPLGQRQWPLEFAAEVTRLTQSLPAGQHSIRLHVNPPELGPVHITLQVGDAAAQANFASPHAHVREALQNALVDLQQQFAQAGLALGQASVSDQQSGQGGFAQEQALFSRVAAASAPSPGGQPPIGPAVGPGTPQRPDALVDTFV